MKVQVSELMVRFMERLGIDAIFGMPGAHILPVYDALYDSTIQAVLAKHEQGASFMAGGYARVSGKIGACITTAGPGAINLVTGIGNAYADKQPILIITGEAPTYIFGKGGLQESTGEGGSIDQSSLFKGITRYHKVVERADYLENVLNRAAKILLSDSPGPVLLSFPFNVQKELVDDAMLERIKLERPRQASYPAHTVQALTDLIDASSRPLIVAGYGCLKSDSQHQVTQLSEMLNIPVTSSLKGKGSISEYSAMSLGSLGVTSIGYAYQYLLNEADLVIFLGAAFNERTSYVWNQKLLKGKSIVQVDIDPQQLDKVFRSDLAIEGDIKQLLIALLDDLRQRRIGKKVAVDVPRYKKDIEQESESSNAVIFNKEFALVKDFFSRMEKKIPGAISVFDDNIVFAQNFFNVSDGSRYYPNSGISSLGHAIPAAIGAGFYDKKPMFAIIGDGGFQMCCMELMTAVNYNIPLTVVLFNNQTMGLIRKNQSQQYDKRFINCDFVNPDFSLLAASFGIQYRKIEHREQIEGVFDELDFVADINLIEIMLDKDAFPNYVSRR